MATEIRVDLPFYTDAFSYSKAVVKNRIAQAKTQEDLIKALKYSTLYIEDKENDINKEYEAYRRRVLIKWLDEHKRGACVQSIGSAEGWRVSFYFDNYKLEGFREDEIELIKQAAIDTLNQDEKASQVGTFTKVIEIEKDICSSTSFTCAC